MVSLWLFFPFMTPWNERRDPPSSPTGKMTWGGGRISRAFDFPGRPILPPIRMPARDRICIPDRYMARERPSVSGALSHSLRIFRSAVRPRHAQSAFGAGMRIIPSVTVWGTRRISRCRFSGASAGRVRPSGVIVPAAATQSARARISAAVRSSQI